MKRSIRCSAWWKFTTAGHWHSNSQLGSRLVKTSFLNQVHTCISDQYWCCISRNKKSSFKKAFLNFISWKELFFSEDTIHSVAVTVRPHIGYERDIYDLCIHCRGTYRAYHLPLLTICNNYNIFFLLSRDAHCSQAYATRLRKGCEGRQVSHLPTLRKN